MNQRYSPRRSSSSSFVYRGWDFPNLHDSIHLREVGRGNRDRNLNKMLRDSPFVKMADDSVLLKFSLIELHWPSKPENDEFRQRIRLNGGKLWNSRWFKSPPKVKVVPSILGLGPYHGTCGIHRQLGEEDGEVNLESTPNTKPPPKTLANLSKFVGHLWKGVKGPK